METHIKETATSALLALCVGNSPVTGEFSAQWTNNTEKAYIWWRHYDRKFTEDMFNFSINSVPTEGLTPLGAKAPVGAFVTENVSHKRVQRVQTRWHNYKRCIYFSNASILQIEDTLWTFPFVWSYNWFAWNFNRASAI